MHNNRNCMKLFLLIYTHLNTKREFLYSNIYIGKKKSYFNSINILQALQIFCLLDFYNINL